MTEMLEQAADAMEAVIPEPSMQTEPSEALPEERKPKRIKRKLKTKDVKRMMKIFGRVREMQAQKAQARYNVALAESKKLGIAVDDVAPSEPNYDFATLLLTEGSDTFLKELNMLFADVCGVKPNVKPGASKWDVEDAINQQIEEEDLD